ncbi:MAG TPA: bifunctional demethylmenaquinone methyltransferase/2-methoxy-6-polyprenyl-1,4-benzoquinol methylase UbiE [Dongiaceae bacterium]|jgi:demethylmenaquinone methyltransferase/2-methoxy-6-polyprenyl-1,4-benzoquinol methylase|nr:bifunctional demethylmenaquinone methyltransferase/2-methoxy-6-polyprenyl-1,4-benzoquinol methylase UbiE [Dongiaceae bacterium]
MDEEKDQSWFGNQRVAAARKTAMIRDVFSSVASKYDVMNDAMSLGIHRLWKNEFVDWLRPRDGASYADIAGGTGDIAMRIRARAPQARVVVCDLTPAMIAHGRDRLIDMGRNEDEIAWVAGDAECLPLADRSVEGVTIAFGLRNVTHIDRALEECLRVLKHGGHFLCLEFSHLTAPALNRLYDLYSFQVLPRLGSWIAKDRDSYVYLAESIRRFPNQEELAQRMRHVGFGNVRYRNLSFGIAAIHSGWRL